MEIAEFQVESYSATEQAARDRRATWLTPTNDNLQAAAESLLLGLKLRGWLAGSEKNLLDMLAVDKHNAFLISGDSFVHPEETELFPPDVITSIQAQEGQALFRHNYRPEGSLSTYTIYSATVDPESQEPVVFGCFGPESEEHSSECYERFAETVTTFRQLYRSSNEASSNLLQRLNRDDANIVIDRCSGRIIYVSSRTTDILNRNERALVDLEYSIFCRELAPALVGLKQTFTNIQIGNKRLALVTICGKTTPTRDEDPTMSGFFVDRLQDRVSCLTMASSYLGDLLEADGTHEESRLAKTIQHESNILGSTLGQLISLFRYSDLPQVSMNPVLQLERAVEKIRSWGDEQHRFSLSIKSQAVMLSAPEDALMHLFEAVLLSHLDNRTDSTTTHISTVLANGHRSLSMTLITEGKSVGPKTGFAPEWSRYVDKLAEKMRLEIKRSNTEEFRNMITSITFP